MDECFDWEDQLANRSLHKYITIQPFSIGKLLPIWGSVQIVSITEVFGMGQKHYSNLELCSFVPPRIFYLHPLIISFFCFLIFLQLGNLDFVEVLAPSRLDEGLCLVPAGTHHVDEVAEPLVALDALVVLE